MKTETLASDYPLTLIMKTLRQVSALVLVPF